MLADFRIVQEQNGGGLPPSREELHHILTQIYQFQTGRQVPSTFFQAVVDGLISDAQKGGVGELSRVEIQHIVANFTSTVGNQFAADSPLASADKLVHIHRLMSEFSQGLPLSIEEQAAYNQSLASILPGFKALFTHEGHFQAFEQLEVVKVVTTNTQTTNEKISRVDSSIPHTDDKYLEYELPRGSEPEMIFSINQGLPNNVASWEDVFSKANNDIAYSGYQQSEPEEGLLSNRNNQPPNTLIGSDDPANRYPTFVGSGVPSGPHPTFIRSTAQAGPFPVSSTAIDRVSLNPPLADKVNFSASPAIVRTQYDRQLNSTSVYSPRIDPALLARECIMLTEAQAKLYYQWRASHQRDPFDLFMDEIRQSPYAGPNLVRPPLRDAGSTPSKETTTVIADKQPAPVISAFNTASITGTTSHTPATLQAPTVAAPVPRVSISSSGVKPGVTLVGQPVLSTAYGMTSYQPITSVPMPVFTSGTTQTPLRASQNVATVTISSRPTGPTLPTVVGTIPNLVPPVTTIVGQPVLATPGPVIRVGQPQLPTLASHLTTSVNQVPLGAQVYGAPKPVTIMSGVNTPAGALMNRVTIQPTTTVTVDRDYRQEIKVVEERSNGYTPLPVVTSKTVSEHQVSHETRVIAPGQTAA